MVVEQPAQKLMAATVNNLQLVAGLHAQHAHSVPRVGLGQCQRCLYVGSKKLDHKYIFLSKE
jgi:hypothetical protein